MRSAAPTRSSRISLLVAPLVAALSLPAAGGAQAAADHGVLAMLHAVAPSFLGCVEGPPIPLNGGTPTCPRDGDVATLRTGAATATFRTATEVGGPLRAASTLSVANGTAESYTAFSRTGFHDRLTIPPGAATFARFFLAIDGTGGITGTDRFPNGRPTYAAGYIYNFGTLDIPTAYGEAGPLAHVARSRQYVVETGVGTVIHVLDVPLVGATNNLLFFLSAVTGVSRPSWVAAGDPWSASGESNFLHSAHIGGVQLLDAAGRDVTARVPFAFASGTIAAVPEPTTVALVGLGLAGLAAVARRRRAA